MAIVLLFIGAGLLFLGFRGAVWFPTWPIMARRLWLGTACILGGLVFWLATAVLLVYEQRNYMLMNLLAPVFVFLGIALFLPPPNHGDNPPPESEPLKLLHGIPGRIVVGIGMALGVINVIAMSTSREWVITLLRFYYDLGLRGPMR